MTGNQETSNNNKNFVVHFVREQEIENNQEQSQCARKQKAPKLA